MKKRKVRVAVGLSGGVDSSLAAALLRKQDYEVFGVTMEIYDGSVIPKASATHACYGPGEDEDIEMTAAVADQLAIPLHVIDLHIEYREHVLSHFTREYLAGRTPNPCTRCNPLLKFGFLIEKARATGIAFDRFATGHYAQVLKTDNGPRLARAINKSKDQSYFIYGIPAEKIGHLHLPLGSLTKPQVRQIASQQRPLSSPSSTG